jgi:pilus assembly protein Flp/PilA
MKNKLWMLSIKIKNILDREEGQDLIEYALLCALIALAATLGMKTVANDINAAFTSIGAKLVIAVG